MISKLFKTPTAWLAALALLPVSACSDMGETGPQGDPADGSMVAFKISGMPYLNSSEADAEKLSEVNVFHFKGDAFLQRTDIADPYAESIALPSNGTTRIYCVSGATVSAPEGISEADFVLSVAESPLGAASAPMFYSGTADFTDDNVRGGRVEVSLVRSVARIDFVNTIDTKMVVKEIVVEDAPASTYVFDRAGMPGESAVTYRRKFDEPFTGTENGMFTIFGSDRPVHVRIIGDYGDSPLNIRTTLPSVERNKIYTLQMVNAGSSVEGAFTIKDWEEGGSVDAFPSTGFGLNIDKVNSVIPEGVDVDYENNIVRVASAGAENIKLAFLAATKVSIVSVEGEIPTAQITANEPVKVAEGYVSSFNVNVRPNNRLGYTLLVNIKDETGKYNFVEIEVAANSARKIETVEIAGLEWMAFNTTSGDLDDQVYTLDGLTVEEMYQYNWVQTVGNFFQYGRRKGYSPWTRNDPNGNSETPRNIPWASPDCMPAPAGYHVASAQEWLQLLPAGTTIPSTYTAANGEEIKAELVTLPGLLSGTPSKSANNAKLLMRYLRFESMKTGNVLILPVCGQKTNSWDEYPGSGRIMHNCVIYWISNDRCVWVFTVADNNGELKVTQKQDRWNYDGFCPVRCIKDKE